MNSSITQQPTFCLMVSTEWDKQYDRWQLVNIFSDENLANDWAKDLNELEEGQKDVCSKQVKVYKVQEHVIDAEVPVNINFK